MASLDNSAQYSLVSGSASADYIKNTGADATIDGGAGDDTIYNTNISHFSSINGGAGNDSIYSYMGNNITISGGTGDDTIRIKSIYSLSDVIQYYSGDGNDLIIDEYANGSNWTLQIGGGSGTYSSQVSGSDIIVSVGTGKITLQSAATYGSSRSVNIEGIEVEEIDMEGDDSISNTGNGATINSAGGNDTVDNSGSNVSLDGGAGNDSIKNTGTNATINGNDGDDTLRSYGGASSKLYGGAGNDFILNGGLTGTNSTVWSTKATLSGGTGNDTFYSWSDSVSVSGDSGDDWIFNNSDYVTITGGTGNDSVSLTSDAEKTLIKYTYGDGNDSITGFNTTSTLQIGSGSGTYSSQKSGNDIIVTVGDGSISLIGAATLSTVNISGVYRTSSTLPGTLTGTAGADFLTNAIDGTTIQAFDGDDTITNNTAASVSVDAGAGNDSINNTGSYVTITASSGNNTITNSGYYPDIKLGSGNDSIRNYANAALIYGRAGDDYIYNSGTGSLIRGGDGNDTIENTGAYHLDGGNGNDSIYSKGSSTTIEGGSGSDTIDNYGSTVSILGGADKDTIRSWNDTSNVTIDAGADDDYVFVAGSKISVNAGAGNDHIGIGSMSSNLTIYGGAGDDKFGNYIGTNNLFVYTEGDGNDSFSAFGSTDTLQIGNGTGTYSKTTSGNNVIVTVGEGKISLVGAASLSSVNIRGTLIEPNSWTYSNGTAKYGDLVTVSGVKSVDGLSISGKVITVGAASLDFKKVTVSDGYTLKLGDDVSTPTSKKIWNHSGTTATYDYTTGPGYTLASDSKSISYSKRSTTTLATVTGVKNKDALSISGKVITVGAASLNFNKVTVSDGYTLKLGDDVSTPTSKKIWNHSGTTATYDYTTGPGYSLASDSKSISYSKRTTSILATVTGVKNKDALSISGKVITVGAAALDFKKVTVSDGYTLKLASDVSTPTSKKTWNHSGTTATYDQSKSPGYSLASDSKSISYSKRSTTALATVEGVKNANGLSISGKVITVGAASLDFKKVAVSGDYTLKLGSDVSTPTSKKIWNHSGTTATYSQTTSPGYSLASDSKSISYSKRSTTTLATVTGVKNKDALSISGKVITVGAASLNFNKVTVSDGYTLKLADDVNKSTSQNVWSHSGTTATYDQTTSPGYSLAKDSKSISYSKRSTTTLTTITGAKNTSGLSVSGNNITLKNSSLNNKVTIGGGYEFDFAADYGNATIMGSSKADTITARGNNVSVHGGKGDDTIKMLGSAQTIDGGSGKDVFVYESGQGMIVNYAEEDTISLTSGAATISTSGNNVVFNSKVTVSGAADKKIKYIDASGEHIYRKIDDVSFANEGKDATLKDNYEADSFDTADFSTYQNKIITIDATKVSHSLEIVGNKNSNVITGTADDDTIDGGAGGDKLYGKDGNDSLYGGAGNDSLWGGNGSDTLWGGDGDDWLEGGVGKDIFVYSSGHDVISDYEQGIDKIMILSGENPRLDRTNLSNNLTFNLDGGSIVVENGLNKTIEFVDSEGKLIDKSTTSSAR